MLTRQSAGTLPPVLVLAVCGVSARFSTHPHINSEPAYLRGEEWAAPARDIVLKRYDEPNITILTVTIILGLHEFGTCQGGRSWMFAGMATRMAYALQLHREMDHDPLGRKNDKKNELSFTDREIRRRTMWACFSMDRFTASGTERPMFADEDDIKVQLPIKESCFEMEISGVTENLAGNVLCSSIPEIGQPSKGKDNMGVAAYMIRTIALWGRVIKYMNLGGREKDPYRIWDAKSRFADLKAQAAELKSNLPPDLRDTHSNLQTHAAEKLASQYLFMHIAINQIILFLHRFAFPNTPGGRHPIEMPKLFLAEAVPLGIDAANQITNLLTNAIDHHAVAPFIGYCAFLSSTVHVWTIFYGKESLKVIASKHLAENVKYLSKMKSYWGVFHFMTDNLKDIYRQHMDASLKGSKEAAKEDAAIFQFGDWFTKYPHGVSQTGIDDAGTRVKKEPTEDASLSQKSGLQSADEFFHTVSPRCKPSQPKKTKKAPRIASQASKRTSSNYPPSTPVDQSTQPNPLLMSIPSDPQPQPPMLPSSTSSSSFASTHQIYPPQSNPYHHPATDLSTAFPNTVLLPQLDRHLVYSACAGHDPTASSSVSALNLMTHPQGCPPDSSATTIWDGSSPGMDLAHTSQLMMGPGGGGGGGYMGDMSTSAWFMPFNLNPPELEGGFPGQGG